MIAETMRTMSNNNEEILASIKEVEEKIVKLRGEEVIADADVAMLYRVKTKEVNQAVRNNPDKFPSDYMFELTGEEQRDLRSKNLTTNISAKSRSATKVFTEKGLYMLATVLKSARATQATLAIIETYAQVRSMVRDMEAIQTEKAGSSEQASLLTRAGHKLAGLIGDNLSTKSRKTTIELNLALLKITHEVTQRKEAGR